MSKQANVFKADKAFHDATVLRLTERLGVDIPADLKMEVSIKARRAGLTMTEIVTRLLSSWMAGEIKLPEK